MSLADNIGRVFHWNGGIYRGIRAIAVPQVRELFASGCLDELTRRGLFPRSRITEHNLDGFLLVVEHEAVPFVTYPHEWSFDMFRDAALAVLEVSEIAARYGWSLKDCHPYNVLFHGSQPLYVDMGSFIPATHGVGFAPGDEFLRSYWRPLSIWASGDYFLAQRIIASAHEMMPSLSWQLYRNPMIRSLGPKRGERIVRRWELVQRRGARMLREGQRLSTMAPSLANRLPSEFLAENAGMLRRKIVGLSTPSPATLWGDYHDEYFVKGELSSTPRFDRVLEVVRSLKCESVVELGGNQGLLSLLLAKTTPVQRVFCSDADSNSINRLYHYCRKHAAFPPDKLVQPAVINFMIPELNFHTVPPAERARADLVVALAVTHHLTLSQNFELRDVLKAISGYTRQFALVEFMPLGLWDGREAPPVPEWYGPDWFGQAFAEFFDVLKVEKVEPNRVLHLGRLKEM